MSRSMEQFQGKTCKIRVLSEQKVLFFTGFVTEVSDLHISFIDKYDEEYMFLKSEIAEISTKTRRLTP